MEVFLWKNTIGEACPGSLLWLILLKEFHQLLLSDLKLKSARKVSFVRQYLAQCTIQKRIPKLQSRNFMIFCPISEQLLVLFVCFAFVFVRNNMVDYKIVKIQSSYFLNWLLNHCNEQDSTSLEYRAYKKMPTSILFREKRTFKDSE